jgi:hypothetical protein
VEGTIRYDITPIEPAYIAPWEAETLAIKDFVILRFLRSHHSVSKSCWNAISTKSNCLPMISNYLAVLPFAVRVVQYVAAGDPSKYTLVDPGVALRLTADP